MRLPRECYQMQQMIETHSPHLSQPQSAGLVLWVCGAILAGSPPQADQNAVASALYTLGQVERPAAVPQGVALRRQRPGPSRQNRTGREPLLRAPAPVGSLLVAFRPLGVGHRPHAQRRPDHGHRHQRPLPSAQGERHPRGLALHHTTQRGSWADPTVELLRELAPAVPQDMTVIVLCDRGTASPKLWTQIREQGWHPGMRYRKNITFCADGGRRLPAQHFVSVPDTAWIGRGTAFSSSKAKRRCTLLVVWYAEQEEPWIILTDLPPDKVGPSWYALRFWIELGFKALKSLGWQWDKTRRTDPTRVSRHWLALSVATLLALAYGTRVEDAQDRRIAPGNLRAPPKALSPNHRDPRTHSARTVSVIRHGID